jgi:hypothetical protein
VSRYLAGRMGGLGIIYQPAGTSIDGYLGPWYTPV